MHRYLVQFNIDDGIQFIKTLKLSPSPVVKMAIKYHKAGFESRCWSCGMVADSILVRELYKSDKITIDREELIVAHVSKTGIVHQFTRDHIVPLSVKGPNCDANYRFACGHCNHQRGSKMTLDEIEFAKKEFKLFRDVTEHQLALDIHVVPYHAYRGKKFVNPIVKINLPWQDVYSKITAHTQTEVA